MTRTSVLALGIGSGAAVLVVVVGGVLLLRGCSTGSSGVSAKAAPPDLGASAAADGMSAKGTAQMRALGCEQALVVDMARVLGGASHIEPGEPRFMVTCDVGTASTAPAPGCERVSAVYFGAVGIPDGDVCVRVLRGGAPQPLCSRLYAPTGADLGTFPPP